MELNEDQMGDRVALIAVFSIAALIALGVRVNASANESLDAQAALDLLSPQDQVANVQNGNANVTCYQDFPHLPFYHPSLKNKTAEEIMDAAKQQGCKFEIS